MKIKKFRSKLMKSVPQEDGLEYKIKVFEGIVCMRMEYEGWMSTGWMTLKGDPSEWDDKRLKEFAEDCKLIVQDLKDAHEEQAPIKIGQS